MRTRRCHRAFMSLGLVVTLAALAGFVGRAYDIRIASPVSVVTLQLGTLTTQLPLGGRVGNWRTDGKFISDSAIGAHLTDIFTLPATGGVAPTLISDNSMPGGWTSGDATPVPPTSEYVGNAWTCPGNEYTLFQASEFGRTSHGSANPGAGLDNNVWIYRASSKTIWRLTAYPVNTNQGVLGPQCSEDPIVTNSSNPIHIVFAHLIDTPASTCSSGAGPSDGKCQWFGDWEVCFADVNRDSSGNPQLSMGSYLINQICEKPRDIAANPIAPYPNGTGVSITNGSTTLTSAMPQFSSSWVGSALTVPGAGVSGADLKTSVYTYTSSTSVTLAAVAGTTVTLGSFAVANKVIYEPHRYVTNLGDFYYTSNRRITTHDAVGAIWNHTTHYFREYTAGAPAGCPAYANTWFDEFLTPNPQNQHAIFMSDRAQPCGAGRLTLVPEYSDHYMCTMPECTNKIRLTYFNTPGFPEYHGDGTTTFDVSIVTAVRGAWSPDGTQYVTMTQYGTSGNNDVHAQFNVFTLRYPSAELDGKATLSGKATLH